MVYEDSKEYFTAVKVQTKELLETLSQNHDISSFLKGSKTSFFPPSILISHHSVASKLVQFPLGSFRVFPVMVLLIFALCFCKLWNSPEFYNTSLLHSTILAI